MNKKTFTLIELLVVISIIGILFSILLPSLQTAKEKSLNVVCISNLSQISKGSTLLSSDLNGTFPLRANPTKATHLANGTERDYLKFEPYIALPLYACPLGPGNINFDEARNSNNVESHYSIFWGLKNFYTGDESLKNLHDGGFQFMGDNFQVLAMDYSADSASGTENQSTHFAGQDEYHVTSGRNYIRRRQGPVRTDFNTLNYTFIDGSAKSIIKIKYNDSRLRGVPVRPRFSTHFSLMPATP